jgi:hypothetical protein
MLSAKAPGQNSIGTGGQYSIGANTCTVVSARGGVRSSVLGHRFCDVFVRLYTLADARTA